MSPPRGVRRRTAAVTRASLARAFRANQTRTVPIRSRDVRVPPKARTRHRTWPRRIPTPETRAHASYRISSRNK